MYKNQSDAATHAQYQHQAKYDTRLSVCKKRANKFQIELEFVLLPRNNL